LKSTYLGLTAGGGGIDRVCRFPLGEVVLDGVVAPDWVVVPDGVVVAGAVVEVAGDALFGTVYVVGV
jgi:hypothetical protein